ncbi:AMME syndrome candidate protein 1 protein, partial [Perkinsus olseni]
SLEPIRSSADLCAYCFDVLRAYYKLESRFRMNKNIEADLSDMPENLHPEVMTDGIFVTWDKRSPSTNRSATFLPNVMPEQHWDQVQAVKRAIMKAGGSSRDAQHPEALHTTVQRYQSSKFSLTFEEYAQMRGIATFD